eukprot:PLAT12948.1.p1 GENE.PLAT12948.1~~PLAT12948.1.p1  ORF type:complete len:213 (+),score=102.00 PLAT12948.1:27-641(+)
MSRRKGVSFDEKRRRLLSIMFEGKTVFNLKELEKLGGKAGVVPQSVKDVVGTLLDDQLIRTDKIGSGNFYWLFPRSALELRQRRIAKLEETIGKDEERTENARKRKREALEDRVESEERVRKLARLEEVEEKKGELSSEYDKLRRCDPELLTKLESKVEECKTAVNRWTDNVWTLQSYIKKKFGMPGKEVDKALGIPADFDYVT